jgi:hypothetical protein
MKTKNNNTGPREGEEVARKFRVQELQKFREVDNNNIT